MDSASTGTLNKYLGRTLTIVVMVQTSVFTEIGCELAR